MSRATIAVTTVLLAALAAGCDENLSEVAGPTPNLTPTFSSIQRDIFQVSGGTGCSGCHNPNGGAFRNVGLDLSNETTAYNLLVGVSSVQRPGVLRVSPGNPDASYLIQKLDGRSGVVGLRMPRNGPPYLTDGQIQIIRRWIAIGAPRN